MHRRFSALASLLLVMFALPLQAAPPIPADLNAPDLLRRMLQAENSLAFSGDQVTTVSRGGLDLSSEQQVQRAGARALRIEYLRPPRLAGEIILDNGRFYSHFIPSKDTLELSPSRIHALRARVPEVIRQVKSGRLTVQWGGQDVVAGRACGIVLVAARSATPVPSRRFWIDLATGAQLRIEQYDAAGHLQTASYYTQITYNPAFVKGTFRLPPSGKVEMRGFQAATLTMDEVRQQAGAPVPTPTYLPEGFRFGAGAVSDARGRRVIELRYVNGVNVLSLFETPNGEGSGPARPDHPRQGVLFGRQAGMKVVLIGNLVNAELEKVLESMR